jgi:hypothetical protein
VQFYESLALQPLSPEYVTRLSELLPTGWILRRDDIWVHARCPGNDATATRVVQGFKIHVSSAPIDARRVLDIVVPVCVDERVDFKIAGDSNLLRILNSKQYARGSSGKFMTIYPSDEECFKSLIEQLYQKTRDESVEGAYILSDRQYKDSKVLFYRYGGFNSPQRVNVDGTHTAFLISPNGEWVPDERRPYFHLPSWVRDPFGRKTGIEHQPNVLLNDRYRIEGSLGFSNAGGIYFGVDTATEKSVVVKEARPLTNCWSVGERARDAVYLLGREYEMLRRLEDMSFIPNPIGLFKTCTHTFLVEELIDGINLNQYWARPDLILAPYIRRAGRIERWVPRFRHVADMLIEMVAAVHRRGILLGDLSPRNILINVDKLQLWFVDLESAVVEDDDPDFLKYAARWGTPGFLHPGRASRNKLVPEDDFYAVAMILYSALIPVNALFKLNPMAQTAFLDSYIDLGVPIEVKKVIDCLLEGDVQQTKAILDQWIN